jgi:hypothetical protein
MKADASKLKRVRHKLLALWYDLLFIIVREQLRRPKFAYLMHWDTACRCFFLC